MRPRVFVLGALALLQGAVPLLAGMCAIQDVPAATLLAPYFLVSRNGSQGGDLPEGGADTLLSITNTGETGVIVQATVWNKYGKPVLAWNIPLYGHDVAFVRMKDVLNGKLNVNPNAQQGPDPCGQGSGWGPTFFTRFSNPDPEDAARAQSVYSVPAFSGESRLRLWDSLDESGDVKTFTSAGGAHILDQDNPCCGSSSDGRLNGDFSGSVTFDVMNTCTSRFPDDPERYTSGVLATSGWEEAGATPNVLMGDILTVDAGAGGHVSADSMVSLVFDPALWTPTPSGSIYVPIPPYVTTFYGRYARYPPPATLSGPPSFLFEGDGRMPLGTGYTVRHFSDSRQALSTRLVVWRSGFTSVEDGPDQPDLCRWWRDCVAGRSCSGFGWTEQATRFHVLDANGNPFVGSGYPVYGGENLYAFLQTQRVDLLDNSAFNPPGFKSGSVDIAIPGDPASTQAYVSVQHTGAGLSMSVGHAATVTRSPVSCEAALP